MKEQEPKRPSWEEFWSYLKREGKGHTEFRLVLYENKTAYIHVMNRDSESFNFELPKIDWDEAERRASFELSPDWTEEEYEWASDLTKELRYDSNLGTDGKKRVIAHLRKWISRVSGETPKPDEELGPLVMERESGQFYIYDKAGNLLLTLSRKAKTADGTDPAKINALWILQSLNEKLLSVSGEAKTPDLTLKLTPEIKLEDGKFILLLNGEKWVKELSGGSVPQ